MTARTRDGQGGTARSAEREDGPGLVGAGVATAAGPLGVVA